MPENTDPELILASRSVARAGLLKRCGLLFSVVPADLDEESFLEAFRQEIKDDTSGSLSQKITQDFESAARTLAELKARKVEGQQVEASQKDGESRKLYVIGCDQILVCDSVLYSKSSTLEELRRNLMAFRAQEHRLFSAAAVVYSGALLWSHCAVARIFLRDFSDAFLDTYLERFGEQLLSSVGGYRIEEEGALLFARLEADPYVVQGLPLLQLLGFLREQNLQQPLLAP